MQFFWKKINYNLKYLTTKKVLISWGFTEKSNFQGGKGGGGGGVKTREIPIYKGNCLKRGGLGQFADLREELGKKECVLFLRGG